jgi:putative FmdB family regulatory protein
MTYTYRCKTHGEFDNQEHMKDERLKTCPLCGEEVQRVYRGAMMHTYTFEGRIVNWATLKADSLPYQEPRVYE